MPAGWGEEERFAAEVERGRTPVGIDDGMDDLAHELEIVALLRSAGPALGPTSAARARAKQRLMSAFAEQHGIGHADDTGPVQVIAPVAVAEPPTERHAEPTPLRARHGGRHSAPAEAADDEGTALAETVEPDLGPDVRRLRRNRPERVGHRRAALLGAAAAAALVALAGTGTFASQGALPGDPMYGVKRVAESTGYALTFGEEAKARRHLEQAQRRLDEVEGMVARDQAERAGGAAVDPADSERVRSTMQEFDSNATEGSRLLLAGQSPDTAQVDDVREWATEQSTRLSELKPTLPAQDKADESLALLNRLLGQTGGLQDAVCDPTVVACPDVSVTDPAETGLTSDPDGTRSGTPEGRTVPRGGADTAGGADGDDADDPTSADDEQAPSGARPTTTGRTTGTAATPAARAGRAARAGPAVPPAVAPGPAAAVSRWTCRDS